MNETRIDFRQQRDFGEVLNATFAFLRLNVGKLGLALLIYLCPFLIIQGIVKVYFDTSITELSGYMFKHSSDLFFERYITAASALLITTFLSTLVANLTVYSYIKIYTDDEKKILTLDALWRTMRKNLFRVLLASFVVTFLFFAGMLMCALPGIYLYVSLCFVITIMIIEGKNFGPAFKRSFSLSHYQWWGMLALLIVLYFILYIVSLVFSIPVTLIKTTYTLSSLDPNYEDSFMKYVIIAITMLSTLAWGFLSCVMYIAIAFKYFSIIEKKESPQLLKDISILEQSCQ